MNITTHLTLTHDPAFDDPDHSDTMHTAIVLRAARADLLRAEEEFGRSVLYLPRVTEVGRRAGRARRLTTQTVLQWPGYSFLHSLHEDRLPDIMSRFHHRHMTRDGVTRIPVSQLQPSRHLEITSAADAMRGQTDTLPPLPSPGDLVSVRAGRWSALRGTVVEVRRGIVFVEVPGSLFRVHAHPSAVDIVDRKKVLA